MRMTPPARSTWLIALSVGALGILLRTGSLRLHGVEIDPFWLVAAAFVLLLVAPLAKAL